MGRMLRILMRLNNIGNGTLIVLAVRIRVKKSAIDV